MGVLAVAGSIIATGLKGTDFKVELIYMKSSPERGNLMAVQRFDALQLPFWSL